jgi:transcriptional regulator with PAS, ATPase and Fis domain
MVKEGSFREDLYHRLRVAEIHLPPLRERISDIPNLYAFIISKKNNELGMAFATEIRDDVLRLLQGYAWPGNIREFEHAIEAAMVKCQANVLTLDAFDLGQRISDEAVLSVEDAVSKVLKKELPWDTIREKGNKRRGDFVKQLVNRLIEKIGSGVTQDILAAYLCTTPDIVKQILKANGISLRATKKSLKKIA